MSDGRPRIRENGAGSASIVVALDFGTTFSGFAYAKTSEPNEIHKLYEWPSASQAGVKPYCKTQTSLYYVPSHTQEGHFELKGCSWSGYLQFTQAARPGRNRIAMSSRWPPVPLEEPLANLGIQRNPVQDVLRVPTKLAEKVGFFASKFKLDLQPSDQHANEAAHYHEELPGDITVERMVVDYLTFLSTFIKSQFQQSYGNHFSHEDVQWCLTVPAIWDERAKQVMKVCAEKAGMVKGANCPSSSRASPYPLDIILEPEAASLYCQHKAKDVKLKKGDKMLVADVGGGTIDLVVQEKAEDDPESMRVEEVVASYGEMGGGTFVDDHFFNFLSQKIGCFREVCRENTSISISINSWWQGIKMGFDGPGYSAVLPLPRSLSEAWKRYDERRGSTRDDYDELRIEGSEFEEMFGPDVEKVVRLIEKQIEGVRVLMVVGGFSENPYLRKRIRSIFEGRVEAVIMPENPGGAICHGAVQLHLGNDIIQSRIAKRTYGIEVTRRANPDDPHSLLFVDDDGQESCENVFSVFVKVGERVPLNKTFTMKYQPQEHHQQEMDIVLYSSPRQHPEFTVEEDASKEGSFTVDLSEGLELDKDRAVEVSMCVGASMIGVSAQRVNFGKGDVEQGLSVSFKA